MISQKNIPRGNKGCAELLEPLLDIVECDNPGFRND